MMEPEVTATCIYIDRGDIQPLLNSRDGSPNNDNLYSQETKQNSLQLAQLIRCRNRGDNRICHAREVQQEYRTTASACCFFLTFCCSLYLPSFHCHFLLHLLLHALLSLALLSLPPH